MDTANTFRPRWCDGTKMPAVVIIQEVEIHGVKGFAIHESTLSIKFPHQAFRVSHLETGTWIAEGATPEIALQNVERVIRRYQMRWSVKSPAEVLHRGTREVQEKISRMMRAPEARATEPGIESLRKGSG